MSEDAETTSQGSPYSMTEELLKARLNKADYGRISTQLYAGLLACMSSISFGTALGWSVPVTHQLITGRQGLGTKNFALLVSMVPLGCSFGITVSSLLMKQLGPKKALVTIAPFYILTWWLMLLPNINLQLAGRFFLGFLGIIYSICGESLLQQTVHYAIKRYVSVFYNCSMLMGVWICNVWGTHVSQFLFTVFCASIPIVHFILIEVAPESPVFLYATSHVAAAKSLAWYRGKGNFYEEMALIKKDWDAVRQDSDAYRYMLFSKVVFKGLLIVVGVTFFQVCSGYFIFLFYNIHVWTNGKIITCRQTDSTIISTLFVLSKLFWGAFHSVFTPKVRWLLIASCLMTAIQLSLLSIYLLLDSHHIVSVYWLPFLILAVFLFCYDMGLNFYPKILIFEYMPFQMFRRAYSLVQSLFWLFTFFNVFTFAMMRIILPSYSTFFILAGLSYVGTLFCYYFVIDPKGKSLIQVQLELGGNPIGKRGALYNQTKIIV
ncbi:plastidic glucose transporter 3 [Asbolus verrucosus]|uniref:Plastidic glucose transporter 3 n=1 Tax=Asbolus verrucosus TaxID=1661398 RepID=A0A482W4E8_ASBVE|nr:plastidic glucose transporter 3 [Asbolus verrucosus]